MSKKILSLALVVVMLMTMFAVSSNAALGEGKTMGLRVVSDAKVGMKAGETVSVTVYYEASGVQLTTCATSLCYNSAVYTPVDDAGAGDGLVWGPAYADVFKNIGTTVNVLSVIATNLANETKFPGSAALVEAYGWDAGVQITQAYADATVHGNTGYTSDASSPLFTLKFTINEGAEVTAENGVIGLPTSLYTTPQFRVKEFGALTYLPADSVDLTEYYAAPAAAEPEVKVLRTQSRWNGGVPGENFDVAYIGGLFNYDPKVENDAATGNLTNITAISCTFTANSETVATSPFYSMWWSEEDSAYIFRAIIKNMDYKDATTAIADVVFTVSTTDKGDLVSTNYATSGVPTTPAAIYDLSVTKGLAAA